MADTPDLVVVIYHAAANHTVNACASGGRASLPSPSDGWSNPRTTTSRRAFATFGRRRCSARRRTRWASAATRGSSAMPRRRGPRSHLLLVVGVVPACSERGRRWGDRNHADSLQHSDGYLPLPECAGKLGPSGPRCIGVRVKARTEQSPQRSSFLPVHGR